MDGPDADAAAARAAEQARIRKERRAAKIRAGGSARLNKITGLSGRPAEAESDTPPPPAAASTAPSDDPAEVDISTHYYEPARTPRPAIPAFLPSPASAAASASASAAAAADPSLNEAQLRNLMLGLDAPSPFDTAAALPVASDTAPQDPFAMFQQLVAGGALPGMPDGPNAAGAAGPGFPGMAPVPRAPASRSAALFRVLHVLFALSLGIFIALKTPFTGALSQRLDPDLDFSTLSSSSSSPSAFSASSALRSPTDLLWMFATGEALLLSARYLTEKNESSAGVRGVLGTVLGFIPQPFGGYIKLAMRYGQFFMTVRNDVMLSVFVLGVCALIRA